MPLPPTGSPVHRVGSIVSLTALLAASGCGAPVFPKQLFTIEASGADCPIMLSKAPATGEGRSIQAESGTHFYQTSSTHRAGNASVTITQTSQKESEMSAAEKFTAKIRRADKWVQVESAVFVGEDFSGTGSVSNDRNLMLEGTVHR